MSPATAPPRAATTTATGDAAIRCTLGDGAESNGVAVTVTSVQGTDVRFGIKVDDQPS